MPAWIQQCCRLCSRRLSKPSENVGPQGCVFETLLLADWRQQSQFSSHDTRQVAALSPLRTPSKLFSFTSFAPTGTKAQCVRGGGEYDNSQSGKSEVCGFLGRISAGGHVPHMCEIAYVQVCDKICGCFGKCECSDDPCMHSCLNTLQPRQIETG